MNLNPYNRDLRIMTVYVLFVLVWLYWAYGILGQVIARLAPVWQPYGRPGWTIAVVVWVALAFLNMVALIFASGLTFSASRGSLTSRRFLVVILLTSAVLSCVNYIAWQVNWG